MGPAFLTAAIYLCLGRIIVIYGSHLSRLRPRSYTIIFMACDGISLVLQSVGGAIASIADTQSGNDLGVNIMIAGLIAQVVSLSVFAVLCAEFAIQVRKHRFAQERKHSALRQTWIWKAFLIGPCLNWISCRKLANRSAVAAIGLTVASLAIYIRSCFRVVELWGGFDSAIANNEIVFMFLEGTMLIAATTCQTVFHPHFAFQGHWHDANFSMGRDKSSQRRGSDSFELIEGPNT